MDSDQITTQDFLDVEEDINQGRQDESADFGQATSGVPTPDPQEVKEQTPPPPQRGNPTINALRERYRLLRNKLLRNAQGNYEDYQLDDGQFGTQGFRQWEADKLAMQTLKDQIDDLTQSQKEDTAAAGNARRQAAGIAQEIYSDKIRGVNKGLRPEVRKLFEERLRGIDWGQPQLRTEAGTRQLVVMLFRDAWGEAREAHVAGRSTDGGDIDVVDGNEQPQQEVAADRFAPTNEIEKQIMEAYQKRRGERGRGAQTIASYRKEGS